MTGIEENIVIIPSNSHAILYLIGYLSLKKNPRAMWEPTWRRWGLKVRLHFPVQTSLTSRLSAMEYYWSVAKTWFCLDWSAWNLQIAVTPIVSTSPCWPTMYADEPALKETGPGFQDWAKDSCWQRWKSDHLLLAQSCQQVRALERLCPNSFLMLNKMGLACSSLCWKDPFIPLYSIYMIVTTQQGKLTSHINNLQPSS